MQLFRFLAFLSLVFFTLAESKDYTITYHGWDSAPATLSAADQNATSSQVAINTSGQAVAVWQRSNGSNNIIQAISSTDNGDSWSSAVNLSAAGQNASDVQVAINDSGRAVAVWWRNNGSNQIVQTVYSTNGGQTWSSAVDLSATGQNAADPQIALNDSGQAVAVWSESGNNVIQATYSTNSGSSWAAAATLSPGGEACGTPQVAINASGRAVIVWDNNGVNQIQADYSADGGINWLNPSQVIALSQTGNITNTPQISLNDADRSVAVWNKNDGSHTIIQASYSTNSRATWLSPTSVYSISVT